jgi:hypothetical protein
MPLKVARVMSLVRGQFVWEEENFSKVAQPGDLVGALTNMREHPDAIDSEWAIAISLGPDEKGRKQEITMPLERFIGRDEYARSQSQPIPFSELETPPRPGAPHRAWFFRDAFYLVSRDPKLFELEEVALRIKASHFERDTELRRLREAVANYEGIERNASGTRAREQIPDDVKLLVWSRDGGACVLCGATSNLHFDHIIPVAKGGGDHAENIRLLCRDCNLKKGARLV